MKNTVVIIPARGGSKGLPRKNIMALNNKPLIHYTIEAVRALFKDEDIYVSTDDEEIKSVVEDTGLEVPFLRPKDLATDTSNTRDVLIHALDFYKDSRSFDPEIAILLQPTSPFRKAKHIKEALSLYNKKLDMVVSVKHTQSNPYFTLFEETKEGVLEKSKKGNFTRRQDCPTVYELNGAIYVINSHSIRSKLISEFTKVKKYVMDEVSSHDIDTIFDWKIAEILAQDVNN